MELIWEWNNRTLDLSKPKIMGIINITPDSFYSGSRVTKEDHIRFQAEKMIVEGAAILDIGGYSSRPGALDVSEEEEWERVRLGLLSLRRTFPNIIVSVDTFRHTIAQRAIEYGADMINDISGGENQQMLALVAQHDIPIILMHKQGTPATMQLKPEYKEVIKEVKDYLLQQLTRAKEMGVSRIMIDPGFGFGKSLEHNYQLLNQLQTFVTLDHPLLVGISRKGMIWKPLNISPEEALNGSTVLNAFALMKGAKVLRVHDVKEANQCLQLYQLMTES